MKMIERLPLLFRLLILTIIALLLASCSPTEEPLPPLVVAPADTNQWATMEAVAAAATSQAPVAPTPALAGVVPDAEYTQQVLDWWPQIEAWTAEWGIEDNEGNLDPHLMASIIQVLTCGRADYHVGSRYGLFGVYIGLFKRELLVEDDADRLALLLDANNNAAAAGRFLSQARVQTSLESEVFGVWMGGWNIFGASYDAWGNDVIRFSRSASSVYYGAVANDGGTALADWYIGEGEFICTEQ